MNLEEATELVQAQPRAAERAERLKTQLGALRNDFYDNLMVLRRVKAYEERFGELKTVDEHATDATLLEEAGRGNSPEMLDAADKLRQARVRVATERNLDTIHVSIEATRKELATLEPPD